MEKKIHQLGNRGMMRDTSISKRDNEHAYENLNIRITAVEKDTLLTVTNEKGTVDTGLEIPGQYLTHCVIGDDIVVFSKGDEDYISLIGVKDYRKNGNSKPSKAYNDLGVYNLYSGNLNFSMEHPMDTLANIETSDCRKVYWVDGINPNRFIDICRNYVYEVDGIDTQFDFMPSFLCEQEFGEEFAVVDKDYSGSGLMPGGVIQYFLTFFNKRGAETGIIWASPRVMPSFQDRGASPDELTPTRFIITVNCNHIDFEYARLYAYHQTSQDAQGNAYIVADMDIKEDGVVFIDNGTNHTDIDPSQLLFLGGQEFSAETITQKSGKMFLGNIRYDEAEDSEAIEKVLEKHIEWSIDETQANSKIVRFVSNAYSRTSDRNTDKYPYTTDLVPESRTFKYGDVYRFGVQFIKANGATTRTYWVGDVVNDVMPDDNHLASAVLDMPSDLLDVVKDKYKSYRLMYVIPQYSDRLIKSQGFVSPTVFNAGERAAGTTYGMLSWITRPLNASTASQHYEIIQNEIQCQQIENVYVSGKLINAKEDAFLPEGDGKVLATYWYSLQFWASKESSALTRNYNIELGVQQRVGTFIITKTYGKEKNSSSGFDKCYDYISPVYSDLPGFSKVMSEKDMGTIIDKASNYATLHPGKFTIYWKGDDFITDYNMRGNQETVLIDASYLSQNAQYYCVDEKLLSMHTPENDTTESDVRFRIVGVAPITSSIFSYDIDAKSPLYGVRAGKSDTFKASDNDHTVNGYLWHDGAHKEKTLNTLDKDEMIPGTDVPYMIHMWHKTGSICSYKKDDVDYSVLSKKTFANMLISDKTIYLDKTQFVSYDGIVRNVLDTGVVVPGKGLVLRDVDKIATTGQNTDGTLIEYSSFTQIGGNEMSINENDPVPIRYKGRDFILISNPDVLPRVNNDSIAEDEYAVDYNAIFNDSDEPLVFTKMLTSPISKNVYDTINSLESKEGLLIVFSNKILRLIDCSTEEDGDNYYINVVDGAEDLPLSECTPDKIFKDVVNGRLYNPKVVGNQISFNLISSKPSYNAENITVDSLGDNPYLFLGELYKDRTGEEYGGTSKSAVSANVFVPVSEIQPLTKNSVYSNDGDTYFQRFDCMTSMPYTKEDINQVIDITSVMLETHVNLDGRYDTKRYQTDLLTLNPENYAPINTAYSSTGNIITSSTLDDRFNIGDYPAMIAHSLIKEPNALVDTWTNITLAATDSLDSANGKLSALRTYNGNILAFQDRAISQILYNERTQLATNIGVPIEVANSSTVSHATITTNYGCSDRRAIVGTKSGVFFHDRFNGILARYGEGFQALSSIKGFDIWFRSHNQNYRLFYDNKHGDIYMNNDDQETLCYNEYLDEFTSFYTYGKVDMMENVRDHFYSLNGSKLWENGAGKYNSLYGKIIGFHTTYKVTPDPYGDKIFTNLDYRADFFNGDEYLTGVTFDKILTGNEYQQSEMVPGKQKKPSINTARQKFRLWKMDIPRVKVPGKGLPQWLRNPWMQLELRKENPENMRMEFHNLNVIYYE